MVRIVHNAQTNSGHTESHDHPQTEINPTGFKVSEKDQEIRSQIKRKHENRFENHAIVTRHVKLILLKIFVNALFQSNKKLRILFMRKFRLLKIHFSKLGRKIRKIK